MRQELAVVLFVLPHAIETLRGAAGDHDLRHGFRCGSTSSPFPEMADGFILGRARVGAA
ncbi:MAG: hypothetical protein U0531_17750 [Dehalococcoidia bacterium]